MSQSQKGGKRDFITKELFILITPFLASYLWLFFYEAGVAQYYGIPVDLIDLNIADILLTNRLTLLAATIAFLWIGLYYNLLPSMSSPLFKGIITLLLIISISLGFVFGRIDAESRVEHMVLNTNPESVVLGIYDDKMIAAPFDRQTKTLYPKFSIYIIGQSPELTMSPQNVGPLIPAKK